MSYASEHDERRRLHERLDEIVKGIGAVERDLAEIKAGCLPCRKQLSALKVAIDGNGNDGVKATVARHGELLRAIQCSTLSKGWLANLLTTGASTTVATVAAALILWLMIGAPGRAIPVDEGHGRAPESREAP